MVRIGTKNLYNINKGWWMMKRCNKFCALCLCLAVGCGFSFGCGAEKVDLTDAVTFEADFTAVVDPPLLKKVAMYNAGCIQPLSNYDRDLSRIREVNAESLRIDLSIGKKNGTGGQYLVDGGFDENSYSVPVESLTYDFAQLDGIVNQITSHEVLPYMSWDYIPYPLQQDGKWNDLDTDISNWKEVWEEVYYQYAKHYKDKGVKIGYHEIYNEPDLEILKIWGVFDETFDGFLKLDDFAPEGNPGKGVYPDMYEYGAKGIYRADPDATIGGPGFALGEIGVEDWVGFLPRVVEKDLPLDFYSFHTYLDGETWFAPEGQKNEIEKVTAGLASNKKFLTTATHINEYSYLNGDNGANAGKNSPYNFYSGGWNTLNGIMEAVERTSVQWIHWAQFMESTGGYDPYGMIDQKGNIKAPFNAMKIYNDIPVWRYRTTASVNGAGSSEGIEALVASTDDKIGYLFWNETDKDQTINATLKNAKFPKGTRRVYRIDAEHASYYDDNENAELVASQVKKVSTDGSVWSGVLPAGGVVYITINKDGEDDFKAWENRKPFADDVKTSYYYEDRYRNIDGSYAHFDRSTWTMYLGQGNCAGNSAGEYTGQAHANASVVCKELPEKFKVNFKTEGNPGNKNKNSALGFRIDFFDETTKSYTKSVYFHNGIYSENRNPNAQEPKLAGLADYPWGTKQKPTQIIPFEGSTYEIDLSLYAPAGWSAATGKAQISYQMQNTGAGSRAIVTLTK